MKTLNIIFMGTPEFSVPSLHALAAQDDFKISLVVTQPDRPKGRGKKLSFSPVKQAALKLGLDVFQPESINSPESLERLAALTPDYFVVVAFGQILSQKILDIPKIFPINIHGSLLPKYRGASPIQAAVMNMDEQTGITTMVMAKGMDTGDILLTASTPLNPEETAPKLHDRLSVMGGDLIVETLRQCRKNTLIPIPQDPSKATYVPMLEKSDGRIDWTKPGKNIVAHINAMTPWPGTYTHLNNIRLKIFKAIPLDHGPSLDPGVIFQCDNTGIHVATGENAIVILELMGASGKRMSADAFLRGHKIDLPARFEMV
ncbi:MAG: methionyl-tRNA formyltransferase [Proteobacteria bacterium]|nr:methionyl-tRNA formyltransferase [Desulfobacula sp.]MBU3954216.1 methionyl-tRNA formyltransferase [Pseudomonadota bacterium]MBU4130122.1 methionyl-tRNA formyltransferase [Pseudomonadota bacterium]